MVRREHRLLGKRLKKHFRAASPIYDHANTSGHHTQLDSISIVGRQSHTTARTIKEVIFIRVNDSFLNRNTKSTSCATYRMRPCSTCLTSTTNRLSLPVQLGPLCNAHNTSLPGSTEVPHHVSTTSTFIRYGFLQHHQFGASHLGTRCLSLHNQWCHLLKVLILILVSITFSHWHEEALLFAMVKASLHFSIFLFYEKFGRNIFFLYLKHSLQMVLPRRKLQTSLQGESIRCLVNRVKEWDSPVISTILKKNSISKNHLKSNIYHFSIIGKDS